MLKYYDTKEKKLYDISSYEIKSESTRRTQFMGLRTQLSFGGQLTIKTSSFNFKHLQSMMNEMYSSDGKLHGCKSDYARDIIIMEDNNLMKCSNSFILNVSIPDFDNYDEQVEVEFSYDECEFLFEDDDSYYDIIREVRANKINDLLD